MEIELTRKLADAGYKMLGNENNYNKGRYGEKKDKI